MSGHECSAERAAILAAVMVGMLGITGATTAPAQVLVELTTQNVAFGGKELESPVGLPGTGKYIGLLTIANVALPTVKEARALLQGALSVKARKGTGKALVEVRMAVNGAPENEIWSTSLADGGAATVSFLCNAVIRQTQTYTYALQVAVIGTGKVTAEAGDFHLTGIPTPQVPIP